ncbi:MAG TPA: hypothetical protein V6C58_23480, partial [Allocoleopsis sp.]
MADKSTTVGVNINVTDNGTTAKATKEAEKLNKTYKEAAKSASSIHVPAAQRQAQMYNSAKRAPVKDNESGIARGIGGVTGAEGRDFAKQAQGLGGLVHLYATFAANIFAVSAAFGALSKAADTTNMIKGLDQLGVASGRSLGNLSKQFASATDNAISMREAMEATVKASSSGMSSDNILRIAKNAKAASQALGVDMGDAVSRLTRGITKLEPELLDELGLFTRVDKAVADYASSVNKSVAGLTEFERRQAYANAVLTEAESKFSKIKIDANPYNQLAASMQNVLQTGLEIINVVLKPIAKLLGESPTALAAAMAGMVTVLVKQAVPAISNFRAGLADSADRARKRAMEVASSRVGRAVERDETLLKATAEELGTLDNHVRNLASSVDTLDKKYVGANSNLKKFATNVKGSTEYLGNIQNQQKAVDSLEARLKKINTLTAEGNTLHKDRLASYIKEKAIIEETISSL